MKKLLLPLFGILLLLSGCTEQVNEVKTFTVTFNTNGGTDIEDILVNDNESVTIPEDPTKDGFVFIGWTSSEDGNVQDGVDTTIMNDVTWYANWAKEEIKVSFFWDSFQLGYLNTAYATQHDFPNLDINGFDFGGWYLDPELTIQLEEIITHTDDFTVYGKVTEEVLDFQVETVNLESLPYHSYLSDSNPLITITFHNIGSITLQLFPDVAPNSVNNMIQYIQDGDYVNAEFHRIIADFMIQGGRLSEGNCPIEGEFLNNGIENDLSHYRGVISMARTNDMDSATSQFFIVHENSSFLDGNYAGFGAMVNGFNVLDYIATLTTDSGDVPYRSVIVEGVTLELNGYVPTAPVCYE